jgi:hypothetical protein
MQTGSVYISQDIKLGPSRNKAPRAIVVGTRKLQKCYVQKEMTNYFVPQETVHNLTFKRLS